MPLYLYQNEETGEVKEIFQSMNEKHEYFEDGVEWKRVFTVPNATITNDAFNTQGFIDQTSSQKGTVGDLLDKSQELSEKRAKDNGGVDPLKKKYFQDYSKKRDGRKHPSDNIT